MRPTLDCDRVTSSQQQTRDVASLTVNSYVAVCDELTCTSPVGRKTKSMNDVIKTTFHDRQQLLTGVLWSARSDFEITAKLTFKNTVESLQFLLFTQPNTIFT